MADILSYKSKKKINWHSTAQLELYFTQHRKIKIRFEESRKSAGSMCA